MNHFRQSVVAFLLKWKDSAGLTLHAANGGSAKQMPYCAAQREKTQLGWGPSRAAGPQSGRGASTAPPSRTRHPHLTGRRPWCGRLLYSAAEKQASRCLATLEEFSMHPLLLPHSQAGLGLVFASEATRMYMKGFWGVLQLCWCGFMWGMSAVSVWQIPVSHHQKCWILFWLVILWQTLMFNWI